MQANGNPKSHNHKLQERVLVVPAAKLEAANLMSQGLVPADMEQVMAFIQAEGQFLVRYQAEEDEGYNQIIPYLVYKFHDQYFLMQRSKYINEQRLMSKYSLGIGGHINAEDLEKSHSILGWAEREFCEEVHFTGSYRASFLGVLNDLTNAVGRVHTGLIFLLEGDSSQISVQSEHDSGELVSLSELQKRYDQMETWSQIILDHIKSPKTHWKNS